MEKANVMVKTIEGERGRERLSNEPGSGEAASSTDARGRISERLTAEEMEAELEKRVEMKRAGAAGNGVTDQHRVYEYIIGELEKGEVLRLMVQASVRALLFRARAGPDNYLLGVCVPTY